MAVVPLWLPPVYEWYKQRSKIVIINKVTFNMEVKQKGHEALNRSPE